ncbi:hypothetical protein BJY52DRAFT_1185383 [Lactarius psammicola]|nr:hypothetical protein BJY52DRAFT_1185383 [Lactarius psammicola]
MSMVNNTELAVGGGKPSTDSTREAGVSIQQALAENANETAMTRSFFFFSFSPGALKRSISKAETAPQKTGDQLREILRWWLSPLDQSSNHNAAAGKARRSGAAEWLMIQRGVYEEWKTAVLQGKRTFPGLSFS